MRMWRQGNPVLNIVKGRPCLLSAPNCQWLPISHRVKKKSLSWLTKPCIASLSPTQPPFDLTPYYHIPGSFCGSLPGFLAVFGRQQACFRLSASAYITLPRYPLPTCCFCSLSPSQLKSTMTMLFNIVIPQSPSNTSAQIPLSLLLIEHFWYAI